MARTITERHYLASDLITSCISWTALYFIRHQWMYGSLPDLLSVKPRFWGGMFAFTVGWLILYFIIGSYRDIRRKSRLAETFNTFLISLIGSLVLLFSLILNDPLRSYTYFLNAFFYLWISHSMITVIGRMIVLSIQKKQLLTNHDIFATLLIGAGSKAYRTMLNAEKNLYSTGYQFKGYVPIEDEKDEVGKSIPQLGSIDQLASVIRSWNIKLVIIAPEPGREKSFDKILPLLIDKDVEIKITPSNMEFLTGSVKTESIYGLPLMNIRFGAMAYWQQHVKRIIDIIGSLVSLIVFAPLFLIIALLVKRSSPGPVFYFQERIGWKGKPFHIIKFRSMFVDAEKEGPALSSKLDPRITKWGRIMRKWRLDELPQLWNILKGDMSFVGPRPERKFYIDQLAKNNSYYRYLLKVKPGLTSWGMLQFGYAENIEEMEQRIPYDLLYLENSSLLIDFKIMAHTIKIILMGNGK